MNFTTAIFIASATLTSCLAFAQTEGAPNPTQQVDREDSKLLQRHHPFYFAYGTPVSKLQVSFKTPLVRSWPLYFGYTQQMFWNLRATSKPFRDLTFNPELMYRWQIGANLWLKSIDLGIWDHHSNGKEGLDSRSYDAHYIRTNFEREGRRWLTRVSFKLSALHGFDETNKDIQRYVGPLESTLTFIQLFDGWVDRGQIDLSFYPGGKFAEDWRRGGYQIATSFRLGGIHLVPAFYLQYYAGYAETLLNYNNDVHEFRGGVVF